jgi:aspartate aminotransferase
MTTQSFAKNFGLYGERIGCLGVVCRNEEEAIRVNGRIRTFARPMYSNPPLHGARVIDIVLGDSKLTKMWHEDLKLMSGRMTQMRTALVKGLKDNGSKIDWTHITNQIGMFAYTGLGEDQVLDVRAKEALYMTNDGRISICGLNTKNVNYVAQAIHRVTKDKGLPA